MIMRSAHQGRVNGKRGWFLILLALVFTVIGLSYLQTSPARTKTFSFLPDWFPTPWVSIVWGIGVVTAVVAAFRAEPRADWIGFGTMSFVLTGWGFIYLASWIHGDTPAGWYSASIFWTFAALVFLVSTWPNPVDPERFPSPPGGDQ